jgi:ABC-type glycerol-3-phosphate transport system permease component
MTMLLTSFKPRLEIYSSISFLPSRFSLENYSYVINFKAGSFIRGLLNSLKIALIVMAIQLITASFAGYALARFKNPVFNMFSVFLLSLYMLPVTLCLIPLFIIFKIFNLHDTHTGLILAYLSISLPFCIWMFKSYVESIPYDLEESAMMEGASQFRAFLMIILPMTKPGLAAVSIYTFINCLQEYLMASVFVKKETLLTMTVALQIFRQENFEDEAALMSASCIASIPMILFLLLAQKYIVAGITAGAVKG